MDQQNPLDSVHNSTHFTDSILNDLNAKITSDPKNAGLIHERAKLNVSRKNLSLALADMKTALDMDSTRPEFFLTLSDLYFSLGKSGNSKAALEKCLSIDEKNVEANLKMAELYLLVRSHDRSIDYIDRALKQDPHKARAYFMKGMNFKEMKDTAKAISSFRTAIDQNSEYYEAFMELGIIFSIRKDKLAVSYLSSALSLRPRSIEAIYARSMYFQETGDYNKAIEGYTSILALEPRNKNAHFNLGFIHQEYLHVLNQAIKHYGNAIASDSSYFEAFYNRGLCFETLGNIQAAREDYKKALALNPEYKPAVAGFKRVEK